MSQSLPFPEFVRAHQEGTLRFSIVGSNPLHYMDTDLIPRADRRAFNNTIAIACVLGLVGLIGMLKLGAVALLLIALSVGLFYFARQTALRAISLSMLINEGLYWNALESGRLEIERRIVHGSPVAAGSGRHLIAL